MNESVNESWSWDERWPRQWQQVASPDLLRIANGHWLSFQPPSCSMHLLFAFLYTIIMIPGILGNFIVIYLFFRCASLRIPANVINVNLALADLLMNLEAPILIRNSLDCGPRHFSPTACSLYGLSGGLSGSVAILSITAMAVQRCFSITRPFDCGSVINMRNCCLVIAGTWLYGGSLSMLPVLRVVRPYTPEGFLTACSFDYLSPDPMNRAFVLAFFVAAYVLPLLVIVTAYSVIICRVRTTQKRFLNAISADRPPAATTFAIQRHEATTWNSLISLQEQRWQHPHRLPRPTHTLRNALLYSYMQAFIAALLFLLHPHLSAQTRTRDRICTRLGCTSEPLLTLSHSN